MAGLITLPPELLLHILSYLPIPSISALQAASKDFYRLVTENEETVYREAANVHGIAPPELDTSAASGELHDCLAQWYSSASLGTADSWKDFCQRRASVLRAWAGARPSTVVRYHPQRLSLPPNQWFLDTPNQVHRIKVDELNGFFITTSRTGGLIVSDIESGKTLWNLPKIYVRQHAHLEYENGYLVFDRPDGVKESWRSESILLESPVEDDCKPDQSQVLVASIMDETFTFVHPPESKKLSPRFVPHGRVPIPSLTLPGLPAIPDHTRAYRMVYPHILAASTTTAYVWDIRTLKRAHTVNNIMSVKTSGLEKNIPEGSYVGKHWWHMLPEAESEDDDEEDEEVWEDLDDGVEGEEDEGEPLLAQASASAAMHTGPETAYPEVNARPERLDMDMNSFIAAAMGFAQQETVAPDSKRPIATEDPVTVFPTHPPFTLGFFDQCTPFASATKLSSTPTLPQDADGFDPLSLATDAPGSLGFVCYVDLSKKWVFVVRDEYLTLYKRTVDKDEPFPIAPGQLAMRMPANRERYGKWKATLGAKSVREDKDSELVKQEVLWDCQPVEKNKRKLWNHLVAVHVSPDEQHLVLLTGSSKAIFIPFFERVIYRQANLYDIAIDIQLGSSASASIYLAYGCKSNPRIGVVTDTGVFIITPYFTCNNPSSSSSSTPGVVTREVDLTIHRVAPFFLDPDRLELISCLMMSDTGLWLTWARGAGTDDSPDAERAMYAALLKTRWASEMKWLRKEEAILDVFEYPSSSDEDEDDEVGVGVENGNGMLGKRAEVEARQRRGTWQEREDGKYGWKKSKGDAKEEAWGLFEWNFVRRLKTPPELQARTNGDQQVVVPGNPHNGDESEILWFECAEVHQVKFS